MGLAAPPDPPPVSNRWYAVGGKEFVVAPEEPHLYGEVKSRIAEHIAE